METIETHCMCDVRFIIDSVCDDISIGGPRRSEHISGVGDRQRSVLQITQTTSDLNSEGSDWHLSLTCYVCMYGFHRICMSTCVN